jgi:cell division protein FtsL
MRNLLVWLVAILVPLMLFLQVNQAYEYQRLSTTIRKQRSQITELIEENNRLDVGRAILENPARIEQIATEELGLSMIESQRIIKVRLNNSRRVGE